VVDDLQDDWWCKVQRWFDGHWRVLALIVATLIGCIVVAVIVHRLNEQDRKLKRAICVEVAFLEGIPNPDKDVVILSTRLRNEVECPPTPRTP